MHASSTCSILRRRSRLVTITGPGGAGKSRLALEVAAGAADGATRAPRRARARSRTPISSRARSPGLSACVRREHSRSSTPSPTDSRAPARSCSWTTSSTCRAAATHVAVASRSCARSPGARPRAGCRSDFRSSECSRWNHYRSRRRRRCSSSLRQRAASSCRTTRSPSVQEICRRLDGLPLAIELVAARLVVLPPAEIVRALEDGLALEMEGPVDLPERQRTLRAAIDWSYGRLTDSQRVLHGTLAVFSESASLADARALPRRSRSCPISRRSSAGAWFEARQQTEQSACPCSKRFASMRSTTCDRTISSMTSRASRPALPRPGTRSGARARRLEAGRMARSARA